MSDKSINEEMDNQLRDMKPCFEVSNSKIFVNLHMAAAKKAAKVVKLNAGDENINQFIINTGMSTDGRYITSKLQAKDSDDVGDTMNSVKQAARLPNGFFGINGNKYEMGIVLQFTEFKSPTHQEIKDNGDDVWKAIWKVNEDEEKKLRNLIFNGIEEYFHWFADMRVGNPDDLIPFIPDYDGGKIKLAGGQIKGMDRKQIEEYLMNRINKGSGDEKSGEHFVPRFGYKVGYTITYK